MTHAASKLLLTLLWALIALPSAAQRSSFEVASIKANKGGPGAGPPRVAFERGRFIAFNAPIKMVLQFAYRPAARRTLRYVDIVGAPSWSDSERYDIEARAEDNGAPISAEQMRSMVQALLAERFQLKAHWEMRDNTDVYNLVVAKDGPMLRLSDDQSTPNVLDARSGAASPSGSPPRGQIRTIANPTAGAIRLTISASAVPVFPEVVDLVQSYARRPVFDKTNLKGLFDFNLQFALDASGPAPVAGAEIPADPIGPSLFTAIQEQLGLKLESAKGQMDVLMIDSLQRPTEN